MKYLNFLLVLVVSTPLFIACNDSENDGKGRLGLSLTDGPIDDENVTGVVISIIRTEVKKDGEWTTLNEFDTPVKVNLLDYQNGESLFLTEEVIEAGTYDEVRLILDIPEKNGKASQNRGTYIEFDDGTTKPLFVPSGAQSGYKAKGEFTVPAGGVVNVTLDFDVRKAVVEAGKSGKFLLKPVVRLIVNQDAGLIEGKIDTVGIEINNMNVFAYADDTFTEDEVIDPLDENSRFPNAITSSSISEDGKFVLAFLNSGTYDLYFAQYDEDGNFQELLGTLQDVQVSPGERNVIEFSLEDLTD